MFERSGKVLLRGPGLILDDLLNELSWLRVSGIRPFH